MGSITEEDSVALVNRRYSPKIEEGSVGCGGAFWVGEAPGRVAACRHLWLQSELPDGYA